MFLRLPMNHFTSDIYLQTLKKRKKRKRKNMDFKTNKMLLVFLFLCIILFNSAQAVCVPRNQSATEGSLSVSFSPTSKPPPSPPPPSSGSAPVSSSPPKSQTPPPSPPPPTGTSSPTEKQETPNSSSPPTLSLDIGKGGKKVIDPQITSLCEKTDHADLCLDSIAPFFNGKSDTLSVLEMLIKASTDQTKKAMATAEQMTTDPKYSDPKTVSRLKDCKDIYDDALDNLQEANDAIADKDIGTIQTMLSATIADFSTCDDGFTGQPNPIPEGVSPMAEINQNLMNISDIMLALANIFQ